MSPSLKRRRVYLILFAVIFISVGFILGNVFVGRVSASKTGTQYEKIGILLKVLNYVENNYVEEVKIQDLTYGAINGMLATLDPHTNFLTPELFKEMKIDTTGQFGGIGIEITVKDDILTIIAPIEDTPAFQAGLKPNDKIVKIEEEFTDKMTLIEAVSKMRGKKGAPVNIYIMREGFKEPQKFTIVRDIIKVRSIKSQLLDSDYGYIKIVNFQERTADDLRGAFNRLDADARKKQAKGKKEGLKGLILDLRNNPGGLLDQAVRVSDLFLEKGVIVSTAGRHKENKDIQYAHQAGTLKNMPVIALVNGSSASASEIVAGALQDHRRAVVVGTKSFGKGSVQQVIELNDQSGLKLTVAKYYTPNGRSIQGSGIEPDVVVEQIEPDVLKAEEKKRTDKKPFWREQDLPRHLKEEEKKDEKGIEEFKEALKDGNLRYDYQLQQAYGYLKSYTILQNVYSGKKQ